MKEGQQLLTMHTVFKVQMKSGNGPDQKHDGKIINCSQQ